MLNGAMGDVGGRMCSKRRLATRLHGSGRTGGTRPSILAVAVMSLLSVQAFANEPVEAQENPDEDTRQAATLDRVEVTGTRIKGGTVPSPVIAIDAVRMREEDFADLGEVVRSVPQNFSGGQNPGVSSGNLAGAGNANQNMTGGSGLNLRGLGADATLTLVNGRRMAYGGYTQAVDISAIPLEAVERVEIVADGASAIYGSDAVGGVGNVVLKRDYDGAQVGMRLGRATQGGMTTREYHATAGATWESGGVIATFKDVSIDPIYTERRDYTRQLVDPSTVYPGSDLSSGLLSAHQALGDVVGLRLDAFRTERDQLHFYNWSGRASRVAPNTVSSLVAPGMDLWLPNDWSLTLNGSTGQGRHNQYRAETLVATGAVSIVDVCYCNESRTWDIGAEGPLFTMPGGDTRLAIGTGYRSNRFRNTDRRLGRDTVDGSESARFAYAEVDVPLVSREQAIAGIDRLSFTAAARTEDYSSFGRVTTPKLGALYSPTGDVTVKASWGKSFKAPTLFERNYATSAFLLPAAFLGGAGFPAGSTVLALDGGNRDLQPERAKTRSLSLAFHPASISGLEAELTWFEVDYTNRVIQPITNVGQALSNPIFAPFVDRAPTAQSQAALLARAGTFSNSAGAPYDPARVVALVYTQYANVARQEIQGVDLSGAYRVRVADGTLTVRGAVSWLDSAQQTIPTQAPFDLAGTLFNPAKTNARAGAVWTQGGFTASLFGNTRSGVTNRVDGVQSGSFTTFDAAFRYSTGDRAGALAGIDVGLSIDNLLDRDPPLYRVTAPIYIAPYDSTNYSAIGRFVSLSFSKRW